MVSRCTFTESDPGVYVCIACGRRVRSPTPQIEATCGSAVPQRCGPGCQLARTFAWFGIRDDGTCGCAAYAAEMDRWGPEECWRRIEEIVEHLRTAAAAKGLPFLATAARIAVARAIQAAESE